MSIEGAERRSFQGDAIEDDRRIADEHDSAPLDVELPACTAPTDDDVWSGLEADPHAAGLEATLQSERSPAATMPKDFIPLDEWYRDMPGCARVMDVAMELAEKALEAAIGLGTCRDMPGFSEGGGGELLSTIEQLAAELRGGIADLGRISQLAEQADRQFLDFAARGDAAVRRAMESMYGRSMGGGGAFGNSLAARLGEARVRETPPAAQTAEAGPAGRGRAGGEPEGYASLDGARQGRYLQRGSSGPGVEALQRALNAAGIQPPLAVDGKFGPATEAAIRKFQQEHGCAVDGIVGPETMGALDRALGLTPRSGAGALPAPAGPSPDSRPAQPGDAEGPGGTAGPAPVLPGTGAARSVLDAARSQLGVREATGNNDGVPAQRYSNGQNVPWCANFVSWAFREAGHPLPGNQVAIGSCDTMAAELRRAGRLYRKGEQTPQPGDVIFFGTPGDLTHVGIVERVEGGRVYTIEGNSGNRVAERSYSLDDARIVCYGRGS